ncbi:polyhydroxyalkanoate biosynthesis repressor PhaR [Neobacillus sp. NPDC093182]|uniref:polyhydroxyalkanoate biosynthesis repressor PhaR n=1 Tax=Neobacillus sp. NPDC093182 TaxID=3364297 RepID=UPI0037FE04A3
MSENNPFDSIRQISEMWEKGLNGLLFQSVNNNPLIQVTKLGIEANSRYIEMLKRNRELMANYMNLPTKNDVANAVKQTMQAEEKIDILEEQIWNLQDHFTLATQEQNKVLGEILEFTKHIHLEWQKASQELAALSEMKNEFQEMKKLLQKDKKEPVLAAK